MEAEPISVTPFSYENLAWVLDVERRSFPQPWTRSDFERSLRGRDVVGLIAFRTSCPSENLGYAVFRTVRSCRHLWNLAVPPEHRRTGVARGMIELLRRDLPVIGASRLVAEVQESNLAGQLFYRAMDFRAVRVIRGAWNTTDEDAYQFVYRVRQPAVMDPC